MKKRMLRTGDSRQIHQRRTEMFNARGMEGQGFYITFSNGYTVSVQWRNGLSYSNNRTNMDTSGQEPSLCAELCAWNRAGEWIGEDGTVFEDAIIWGWRSPEEAVKTMSMIANL